MEAALRAEASEHPVLVAMVEYWMSRSLAVSAQQHPIPGTSAVSFGALQLSRRPYDLQRLRSQLEHLRTTVDSAVPHYRAPSALKRAAAEAIAARHDDVRDAWLECANAGLIPKSWLDEPRRQFFDEDGSLSPHPTRHVDLVAIAGDADGVQQAEDALAQIADGLAPWGCTPPSVYHWMGWPLPFDIHSGPVLPAIYSITGEHDIHVSAHAERPTATSLDEAAIYSVLWADPDTTLGDPRATCKFTSALRSEYRGRHTHTLPDPFAAMLALFRTGYGFELQLDDDQHVNYQLWIPEPESE